MPTEKKSPALPPRPDGPCSNCYTDSWYLPGDYFVGGKAYVCGVCHPAPGAGPSGSTQSVTICNTCKGTGMAPLPDVSMVIGIRNGTIEPPPCPDCNGKGVTKWVCN